MTTEPIVDPSILNGKFEDFIGVWDNFVAYQFCEELIEEFEQVAKYTCGAVPDKGNIMDGKEQFDDKANLGRKDISILLEDFKPSLATHVGQYLQACFMQYCEEYGQLKTVPMISANFKMQRTPPCGGYHVWHYESGSFKTSQRELTWMIYLNDLPDGEGETEFLYQKRRIKPTTGTVVIWPAGMTHVHRGLTVYTHDKYVVTGWFTKVP
jgi:hypothetical protein